MSLETKIMDAMKAAMKEKDKVALESLRAIKSQLLLLKTGGGDGEVTEEQEVLLLQRLVKQRKEAYEQFVANNRQELADNEIAQAKVIEQFLPEQLTPEELENEIQAIIEEVGAKDIKDLGKVMGVASKKLQGKAEGKLISQTVKNLLA
ncbi:GatB/YqeY domain-containing protein [Apibacter muscae]|uniref:GatB/YqeY domain-containing protein n=1 Tax=Apibacter muscae TaxID=2509004 RepID=A0A563DGN9_9FLAO|nr:GatB/YqeY domain-containing protein [Apibacter muscae]TWP29023.1 GatB/YqeY domain-containing protein [Apibacter muscae]TWP30396.1 GatB/YqeY domain-containing protein [Apibacter muscae]